MGREESSLDMKEKEKASQNLVSQKDKMSGSSSTQAKATISTASPLPLTSMLPGLSNSCFKSSCHFRPWGSTLLYLIAKAYLICSTSLD